MLPLISEIMTVQVELLNGHQNQRSRQEALVVEFYKSWKFVPGGDLKT